MNDQTGLRRRILRLIGLVVLPLLAATACDELNLNSLPTFISTPEPTVAEPPTPTPMLMCTPPACMAGEVYYCPGDCPGGCGTVCATPTPSAAGPDTGQTPPISLTAPTEWTALEGWLAEQWRADADPAVVRAALQAAGLQTDYNDWLSTDLDADLRDDWVLTLRDPALPGAPFGDAGTMWIVSDQGVVFRYYNSPSDDIFEFLKPQIVGLIDMNGDGSPEVVANAEICGAHTCYDNYRIIGYVGGVWRDLVNRPAVGEGDQVNVISMSYSDAQMQDVEGDGLEDFMVHGGTIGSVGAGIVRERTELWSWDGSNTVLQETYLDPTQYRHHILYEANDAMAAGDLDAALTLYETAINDGSLRNDAFAASEEETYQAISRFAAFRLILIDLLRNDPARAVGRLAWLEQTYPGSAAAQGAAALVDNWTGQEGLAALCAQIESSLAGLENPTGALADLGYGNPSLTAADFCP